jgi:hypothetical protein
MVLDHDQMANMQLLYCRSIAMSAWRIDLEGCGSQMPLEWWSYRCKFLSRLCGWFVIVWSRCAGKRRLRENAVVPADSFPRMFKCGTCILCVWLISSCNMHIYYMDDARCKTRSTTHVIYMFHTWTYVEMNQRGPLRFHAKISYPHTGITLSQTIHKDGIGIWIYKTTTLRALASHTLLDQSVTRTWLCFYSTVIAYLPFDCGPEPWTIHSRVSHDVTFVKVHVKCHFALDLA